MTPAVFHDDLASVMGGLVPPTRAEAYARKYQAQASAGEGPAIHVFDP
jgi:hypothetical protein